MTITTSSWAYITPFIVGLPIFAGTVLGFHALRDIRLANGRLGGAMLATIAAGLLPALFIIFASGAGLTLFMESLSPAARARSETFLILGSAGGIWLSFLMMRGMHRQATGWVKPVASAPSRSGPATAALVFTVTGAAFLLLSLLTDPRLGSRAPYLMGPRDTLMAQALPLLTFAVILAGLTCGVIARQDPVGKTCAWINGVALLILILLSS